jgi:hypothetical protein
VPSPRHKWHALGPFRAICCRCGMVRARYPVKHRTVTRYATLNSYHNPIKPDCSGVWPDGWEPEHRARLAPKESP